MNIIFFIKDLIKITPLPFGKGLGVRPDD